MRREYYTITARKTGKRAAPFVPRPSREEWTPAVFDSSRLLAIALWLPFPSQALTAVRLLGVSRPIPTYSFSLFRLSLFEQPSLPSSLPSHFLSPKLLAFPSKPSCRSLRASVAPFLLTVAPFPQNLRAIPPPSFPSRPFSFDRAPSAARPWPTIQTLRPSPDTAHLH